ncbi:Bug family tripartite tricarboxylate transporter substrate binding protein [Reyranella sp.]|uniref:Bug family tripartite tricarboxylate transporter substrate binding protein n=1 Tax=Reyranella sp. TaxID=1929291 RepID=UPI003785004D
MRRWQDRARTLGVVTTALASLLAGLSAAAQDFSAKPISIIVGFGAGGATDTLTRLVAQRLGENLRTPVIVENKPGGNQTIAIRLLKQAPVDGHTLYMGTGSSLAQYPALRKDLPYRPLEDFSLISMLALQPGLLCVKPGAPWRTVKELVDHARANPGKLNYGSQGVGSASHLAMEYFMARTGTSLTHIPLKSDSDIGLELAAGRLDVSFMTTLAAIPLAQSGRLDILVTTSRRPLPTLPDLPDLAAAGVPGLEGLDPFTFYGIVGARGIPVETVTRLNQAIVQIVDDPAFAAEIRNNLRIEPFATSPAGFRDLVRRETEKWSEIATKVKLDAN